MSEAFGLAQGDDVPLSPGDRALAAFLQREGALICVESDGQIRSTFPAPTLLLPGAFNPIHAGHWALAEAAAQLTGSMAAFELSITNVDKPPLSPDEVRRRLTQFAWRAPVWLVRAPTFVEKARLFPGSTFVVGADTAERIVAPHYYANSIQAMHAALDQIRGQGCRFLVGGRAGQDGQFMELHHLDIPLAHRDLFSAIPAVAFRVDLSSTAVRAVWA